MVEVQIKNEFQLKHSQALLLVTDTCHIPNGARNKLYSFQDKSVSSLPNIFLVMEDNHPSSLGRHHHLEQHSQPDFQKRVIGRDKKWPKTPKLTFQCTGYNISNTNSYKYQIRKTAWWLSSTRNVPWKAIFLMDIWGFGHKVASTSRCWDRKTLNQLCKTERICSI